MSFKIFFIFLLSLLTSGCGIKPNSNQLNLVMSGDPKSLDPAYATDVRTGQLCALLYDNLVRFGSGAEILPGLSETWEISSDGLEYFFQLKDSVFFQNKKLLECTDIKKSFERILDPATNSHRKWLFKNVKGALLFSVGETKSVDGFFCLDNRNFKIILNQPFAPFLGFLAMPSASIVHEIDNNIVGTGPWKLREWIHDGHLIFDRNENYFDGLPNLETLKFRILPESLPRSAEFVTGYLDIMEVPESEFSIWANDSLWASNIDYQDDLNIFYLGLNCSRPPFNNVDIRKAVNYAVDVQLIINKIKNGNAMAASGPIPPGLIASDPKIKYGFNPQKARNLLVNAGYEDGLEIELWQSQSSELLYVTEAIQAQLELVGINVKIVRNDWNLYSKAVAEGVPDMYYRSWYADYPHAENFLSPLFESGVSQSRWTRYSNEDLDTLIHKIQFTMEDQQQESFINQANSILIEDVPWVYLWHTRTPYISQPNLSGWSPSLMFNAEKYVKVSKQ
ncbi:ABC transporter substrate-binding protein [Candidatus Marinimicrobia bacterium]|nr:ABC transporter substrate-binding protein [Candidatus Neomarinimicrobiota bacterium]